MIEHSHSFLSVSRTLSVANVEGRPVTQIIMSTATWLDLHHGAGRAPTTDPRKEAGSIMGVPIKIDDEISGIRYVA